MNKELSKETMLTRHSRTFNHRVVIMEFLEWIGSKGIDLCTIPEEYKDSFNPRWCPISKTKDTLLNEFFDIDGTQLEKERRELLDQVRKSNERE
jgi:hypothetical protein